MMLPVDLIRRIGEHTDFFSALYMGTCPCLCTLREEERQRITSTSKIQFHVRLWIETMKLNKMKARKNQSWSTRFKSWIHRCFGSDQLSLSKRLDRLQPVAFATWVIRFDNIKTLPIEAWISIWKQVNASMVGYRITRYREEGIFLLWCYYNAQATWNHQFTGGKTTQLHTACFRNALDTLKDQLEQQWYNSEDDFQSKRNF